MDVLYFPEVCHDVILWGMRDRDGTKHLSRVVISHFCFKCSGALQRHVECGGWFTERFFPARDDRKSAILIGVLMDLFPLSLGA